MIRFALATFAIAFGLIPGGGTGRVPQAPGRIVAATVHSHNLELMLWVGRKQYPRDALVLAHERLRNTSSGPVVLSTICTPGLGAFLATVVNVVSDTGSVRYPPALPGESSPSCPPRSPRVLRAGQTIVRAQYVILRARRLEALVELPDPRHNGGVVQVIAPLVLRLTHRDARPIVLHYSPDVSANLGPLPGSPVLAQQWVRCGLSGGVQSQENSTWQAAIRSTVSPLCVQPLEWELVAGPINHSATQIHYVRRAEQALR